MRLYLEDKSRYKYGFVLFIKRVIKKKFLRRKQIKIELLKEWTKYLRELEIINKSDTAEKVLERSLNNLVLINLKEDYIIEINNNIFYNNNLKYIDMCRLINYGNLELNGCFILSDIFEDIQQNLEIYYKAYSNPLKYSKVINK